MSTKQDYYEILGVSKDATLEQIRNAYRQAALRHHPDRVPEAEKKAAEEKFKEISEAYAVLSDSKKRALYDQYGHSGIDQKYAYEDIFKGADFNTVFQDLSEFGFGENLFDQIFGDFGFDLSGKQKKGRPHSHDLQITLAISLEEAATGCEKKVSLPRYDRCPLCHGSGAKPGTKNIRCPQCGGQGQTVSKRGFMQVVQTCSTCHGVGTILTTPCPECHGEGRIKATHQLHVKIPPGVDTGAQLRIHGEGEDAAGDLHVIIEVNPHPFFERKGNDLLTHVAIPLSTAILGGEVSIPTLFGKVLMKIPPGTQNGMKFRLKGKGMPKIDHTTHGDEYVTVAVEIPTHLTAEQRTLMEAFAKTSKPAA
ncbi:MAG: molecular chaperone DnaJ [Rhabdochlamydiaceae bacterium]|jgi:molecular chaperone DnaJ